MSLEVAFEIGQASQQIRRIADVITSTAKDIFVRLPGLEVYFPGSVRDASGLLRDHSGSGKSLVQTGTCATGYDGNSFVHLGNGTNYFGGGSFAGVTGLESFISSSIRGLTVGGWFMIDTTPTTNSGLISRDAPSPERGWALAWHTTDIASFTMSGNGAAAFSALSPVASVGVWNFIVGRFIPSSEVAVIINGDKSVNTTAIPASINVSTQGFEIGRFYADNNRVIHGKVRDVFVCAAALSDDLIEQVRQTSTP